MNHAEALTDEETKVIALAASGNSSRAIGRHPDVSVSHSTANRITNKHKELIQAQNAILVENTLARIVTRTSKEVGLASAMGDSALFDKDNQAALSRIDKKEEMILKSVGIAPSATTSIHVQNIFNDNRKTILSPGVATLLHNQMNDIIDGEIIEDE